MPPLPAIPASYTVQVNPGVLSAGGTALDLVGLGLTANTRVPIGQVYSFATALDVANFFGAATAEANFASVYFLGYNNKSKTPDALLFAQCPTASVPAYLRGGSVAALTLAQLQAISGTVIMTIDGQAWTSSSINLSTATSFSDAASKIQTALGASDAVVTAAIAAGSAAMTASITTTVMTVTVLASGSLFPGQTVAGSTTAAGTKIVAQLTGTAGGTGTYTVSISQTVGSASLTANDAASGLMTVASVSTGTLALGQVLTGSGVVAGTTITQFLTGVGAAGIYVVSNPTVVSSTTITAGTALVTYDSTSGGFVITGGQPGTTGSITFATGTASTALKLTLATGAVTSQGAGIVTSTGGAQTPAAFMNAVLTQAQNWFSFTTVGFKPSITDMVAFAAWTNSQDDSFAYAMWDTDVTVTTNADTTSAGYQIIAAAYSGTMLIYEPTNLLTAAFLMGSIASIDFNRTDGRRNLKFLSQSGLIAGVTSQTIAAQLTANSYNYYGANANATNEWNFYAEGTVTGPFKWGDSYCNQRWLNFSCQTALMTLLTERGQVPFTAVGQAFIENTLMDPINAGLNFGAINTKVPLSALQVAEVNAATGLDIGGVLSSRGWYVYAPVPLAAVRAARGPWDVTLFYTDGGSVNRIELSSLLVQ